MPGADASRRANTFFALAPPVAVRDALQDLQDHLSNRLPDSVRPVHPRNFHVTLAFLGSLPAAASPVLTELAGQQELEPCVLQLDRLGTFRRARVGWVGCENVPSALREFQSRFTCSLRAAGFEPDDRDWVPHLTLYRNLRMALPTMSIDVGSWTVEGFELFRTRSTKSGPEYASQGAWKA